jgi:hypothetical protein
MNTLKLRTTGIFQAEVARTGTIGIGDGAHENRDRPYRKNRSSYRAGLEQVFGNYTVFRNATISALIKGARE